MSTQERKELIAFFELFNIGQNTGKDVPLVIPYRVLNEFRSSQGHRFESFGSTRFKEYFKTHVYLEYCKSDSYLHRYYPAIPSMPNSVKLCVFNQGLYYRDYPERQDLETICNKLSENINAECPPSLNLSPERLMFYLNEFTDEMQARFPDYYFNVTAYGSELYGLPSNKKIYLNVNIELDDPDLDRLVGRRTDPFVDDIGEPYCYSTTELFSERPKLVNSAFNMTKIEVPGKIGFEYSFNKSIVTKSTDLISEYMRLDNRVRPFLAAIKRYAKGKALTNITKSYTFVIMGLAYLVSLDPPVVPNLQSVFFINNEDDCGNSNCLTKYKYWDTAIYNETYIGAAARFHTCVDPVPNGVRCKYTPLRDPRSSRLHWTSSNNMEVGALFLDFMYYYGYQFKYNDYAVSLKMGGVSRKLIGIPSSLITIEDPMLSGINIALKGDPESLSTIPMKFRECCTQILRENGLTDIMQSTKKEPYNPDVISRRYKPHSRRKRPNMLIRTLLLIGLPKHDDSTANSCDCDFIKDYLQVFASIIDVQSLDSETKLLKVTIHESTKLPSYLTYQGKTVHLVELFDIGYQ